MSKASEDTRAYIIAQAAELFNQKGFSATSIADVMQVTGLQKGGIYNHFKSKEELAIAAFDYAVTLKQKRYHSVLRSSSKCLVRLFNFIDLFCQEPDTPSLKGGCPIMNTAIEHDAVKVELLDRAKSAMDHWRAFLCKIIARGIAHQEIQASVYPDEVATLIIATLEGGLMMSQLYDDRTYLDRAALHLKQHLQTLAAAS
ncbi:TetR/AcrR family transcriptional regulator [Leptolyngbya sp. FACHB-17]|uniref:TetR/AcrR family transcriptional regulator n=1 Tax=unclassified Leptolyngbya TaxID=2650499 RepID=UPI0016809D45|nr:TetR/AcrR family transcriptional regulator [Leptolyngbya sp. FACHB-17]MBD2082138.1 TetR/AcrR family transcriptional regulator [Leptolyngbya sp. FACHB-17]